MTSALDMPEIMSYIYSKSWKHQFSASSSIIIIEDYYLQTFLHSLEKSQDLGITNKQTKSLFFASYIHLNNFYPIRYAKLTHRFFITRR